MTPLRQAALLLAFVMLAPAPGHAGDEVDYSAPYLVVEDGKLVTKYPDQKHQAPGDKEPDAAEVAADTTTDEPAGAADAAGSRWLVAAVALVAVLAGLYLAARRRS